MPRMPKPSIVEPERLRALVTQQFEVTARVELHGSQLCVRYQYTTEYDGTETKPSLVISGHTGDDGLEFWNTDGNNEPAVFVAEDPRVIRTLAQMLTLLAERVEAHEIGREGRG